MKSSFRLALKSFLSKIFRGKIPPSSLLLLFQIGLVKASVMDGVVIGSSLVRLRPGTSDLTCFRQVFFDCEYDIPVLPPSHSTMVIVDLGANIGLFTIWAKSRYPDSQVIALEPEPSNYELLVHNVQGLSDVQCLNYAIYSSETLIDFEFEPGGEWGARVAVTGLQPALCEMRRVPGISAITFAKFFKDAGIKKIDILKIDIEGAEIEMFSGDCSWLSHVRVLVIELHDYLRPGCSKAVISALSVLNDYRIEWKGENLIVRNMS